MAEILVESTVGQKRSAFQFDTITPKKNVTQSTPNKSNAATDYNDAPLSTVMLDSSTDISVSAKNVTKDTVNEDEFDSTEPSNLTDNDSGSDDNGGFVTLEDPERAANRVKRATVVGNPMFAGQSSDATEENLGIDDLEMDYDQIMNYFDNLKVNKTKINSNA